MNRCAGYKRDGTPCSLTARGSSAYCWAHDPEHQLERSENAAKGGRARAGGEIATIKARIKELSEQVVRGEVDKGKASVAFQGLGVLCRFIETERKIKADEEIEARLEALEAAAAARLAERGGRQHGAYR